MGSRDGRAAPDARVYRRLFMTMLGLWLAMPVLGYGSDAQDAVPYVVAGDLFGDGGPVYSEAAMPSTDADPAFTARACELGFPNCEAATISFVASPLILPLAGLLGDLDTGILAMRFLAAACLGAGMVVLWRRVRSPRAMAYTAVLLTPLAAATIHLGQTTPILFLSAVVGPSGVGGVLWFVSAAVKVYPAALGAFYVAWRRWRALGIASVAALLGGLWTRRVVGDFVRSSVMFAGEAGHNPYNAAVALGALRLPLLAALIFATSRLKPAARWAFAYSALLLVSPLLWFHYAWLPIAALGTSRHAHRALPVAALASLPLAWQHFAGRPLPTITLLYAVAATASAWLLSERIRGPRERVLASASNDVVIDLRDARQVPTRS